MITLKIGSMTISNVDNFIVIAGPCVIEQEDVLMHIAEYMVTLTDKLGIPYVFKASYDKANRTSINSYRGPGIERGLELLEKVKTTFHVPLLTDVHTPEEARMAADVVDILQIPAFLCRQTDLIVAAAETGKIVNIKKGQFLAPWDMKSVAEKAVESGNSKIILTERGVSFGYNTLITDIRGLVVMKEMGYPVIFDATHSVQQPGGKGSTSGGERQYVFPLAKAALSAGIAGLFMEVHPEPEKGLSDGPNMIPLQDLPAMLKVLSEIDSVVKKEENH